LKLKLKILGQTPSGKNAILITRSGRRVPGKKFVAWREKALAQILTQTWERRKRLPMTGYLHADVKYYAGDRRRRDIPGIIDAVCSLMEYAGIVEDDYFIQSWNFPIKLYDKENPRIEIELMPIEERE